MQNYQKHNDRAWILEVHRPSETISFRGKQPFILFIIVKETKLPLGRIFIKRINKKLFGQRQGLKISTQQGQLQFVYHIRRLVEQIDFQFVKLV